MASSAPTSGVAQTGTGPRPNSQAGSRNNAEGGSSVLSTNPTSSAMPQRTGHCPFCDEQHYAEQCERYKTAQQRSEKLGDKRCKKYFRLTHEGTPCIRNMKCKYCSSWDDNRALCPTQYPDGDAKCLLTKGQNKSEDPPGLFMTFLAEVSNPVTNAETGIRILIDPACN